MAVLTYGPGGARDFGLANLCTSLGGNVDTTNTLDRGTYRRTGLLQIISVAGTTVTLNLMGSVDNTNWWNLPYALIATPTTLAVAALTITTSTTAWYVLLDSPWRFLKGTMSANTGMTLTIDVAA